MNEFKERDWFTVTLDYMATGEGHTRAIWIGRATSEEEAKERFGVAHGKYFAMGAEAKRGLHIENGYADLLTDYAKKVLVKIKAKDKNGPGGFYYTNMISVNYS